MILLKLELNVHFNFVTFQIINFQSLVIYEI